MSEHLGGGGTPFAVVGAGIVGLSAAYALRELGHEVTVYERGTPGAAQSGGDGRIFRHLHADPRLAAIARDGRAVWDEWADALGVELLSSDGVVALGETAADLLAVLQTVGGVPAERVEGTATDVHPLLAAYEGPVVVDPRGGAIRTCAAVSALAGALGARLVGDEALQVRPTPAGTVEVRTGGATTEHERVLVCAGRATPALVRGAGIDVPVRQALHVRLTFPVRGPAPAGLPCLLDASDAFGPAGSYATPALGYGAYSVGVDSVDVDDDGGTPDPDGLAAVDERTRAYVARALPGLDPVPVDVRHCWTTTLPWGDDGVAVWRRGGLFALAGNNLFKHAPALGRAVAQALAAGEVPAQLRPEALLGHGRPA